MPDARRRDAHLQNLGHYSKLSGKDVLAETVVLFCIMSVYLSNPVKDEPLEEPMP